MPMDLSIDVVPNTSPPKFHWKQAVDTPIGRRVQEYTGVLPPNLEDAVLSLIRSARKLEAENAELRQQIRALNQRTEAQAAPKVQSTSRKHRE